MNKKELAENFDEMTYENFRFNLSEISNQIDLDIVIVYGASDDLMEFTGAIEDEIGAYEGATVYLDSEGLIKNKCEDNEECPYFERLLKKAIKIEQIWTDKSDTIPLWSYKTVIPHETFKIYDNDGDGTYLYCEGIIFSMDDLKPKDL